MPASSSDSWRDPRVSQAPIATDRTCGRVSVTSRRPDGNVSVFTMLEAKNPVSCLVTVGYAKEASSEMIPCSFTVEQGSPLPPPLDFSALERRELEDATVALGLPRFRGRQIFQWIHQRGASDFGAMTNLPQPLRLDLAARGSILEPALDAKQVSIDGTTKFLLQLADTRRIEAVYIPDTPAQTFCISTQ